jgi:hypothetical protein
MSYWSNERSCFDYLGIKARSQATSRRRYEDQSWESCIKSIDREFALVIDGGNWGDGVTGGRFAGKRK